MNNPHLLAKRLQFEFLKNELDIGFAFAWRALITRNPEARRRNRALASNSYRRFKEILRTVAIEPAEADDLLKRVERLQTNLKELGEHC